MQVPKELLPVHVHTCTHDACMQVPKELLPVALRILSKALEWGPYKHTPEWFNNDDNFAKVMQETLYLHAYIRMHTYACIHTHTYICMHTYACIHTHTHTYR